MRARLAKKLLKQALTQSLRTATLTPGSMLVLSYDDATTADELQQLASMLRAQSPCLQVLLLPEKRIRLAEVCSAESVNQ